MQNWNLVMLCFEEQATLSGQEQVEVKQLTPHDVNWQAVFLPSYGGPPIDLV